MKDTVWLVLGILGLILSWFLCRGGPVQQAAVVAPAPRVAAPAVPVPPPPAAPSLARFVAADGKVTLEGTVRDDAMRTGLVTQAKSVYGDANVIDKLTVDGALGDLKSVVLSGDVGSQQVKDDTGESVKKQVGAAVSVDNQLRVSAAHAQEEKLKAFLKGKSIEFATGSAIIAPAGIKVLTELVPLVQEEKTTRIEIQGHTDNVGAADANKLLSSQRAQATMAFLVARGVASDRLTAVGYGQDRPIASNDSEEGRQHNRRIAFDVMEGK